MCRSISCDSTFLFKYKYIYDIAIFTHSSLVYCDSVLNQSFHPSQSVDQSRKQRKADGNATADGAEEQSDTEPMKQEQEDWERENKSFATASALEEGEIADPEVRTQCVLLWNYLNELPTNTLPELVGISIDS